MIFHKIVHLFKTLILFCTPLTYRWGKGTRLKHGDYFSGPDRYNPGKLIKHKWESAQTVDKHGWAHRKNINLEDIRDMQVNTISNFSSFPLCWIILNESIASILNKMLQAFVNILGAHNRTCYNSKLQRKLSPQYWTEPRG